MVQAMTDYSFYNYRVMFLFWAYLALGSPGRPAQSATRGEALGMIRVLNIISDTNIGGAGRVILNYLSYADRTQFETLVAIPRGSLLKEPLENGHVPGL